MNLPNRCLLSVAMIVKDEEYNIRRALESIKDVADEIIVVDTGSTDRTPEIVKEYTDKLYFHEWQNDFSEARNYSLKFPTCEWVMIFDADEEVREDFKGIRDFLKSLPPDVNTVYLPAISYLDWDFKRTEVASTPRIFRNGTVSYKNIVHNQAVYKPKVVNANFPIYHYGYIWTRKLKEKKYNRTRNLIIEHLNSFSKNPTDRIYYLIQLYKTEIIGGRPHQKNEVGWKILKELEKYREVPAIALEFLYIFGNECTSHGLLELAERLFNAGLRANINNPDFYLALLELYNQKDEIDKAIEYGEKFFEKLDYAQKNLDKFTWTLMSFKHIEHAHAVLAKNYLKKKNFEKFNFHVSKTIETVKDNTTAERLLTMLLQQITNTVESNDEYQKIIDSIEKIVIFSYEKSLRIYFDEILFVAAELSVKLPEPIAEKMNFRFDISRYIAKKMSDQRDYFIEFLLKEQNIEDFILDNGVGAFLLIYRLMKNTMSELEIIKAILKLKNIEDLKIKGITYALLGDLYLKLGNFKESISSYRNAIEILPEISMFIKPIVEDLKTRLDKDIDGSYEELVKYFSQSREFLFDLVKYIGEEQASKLHLLSDSPIAIYTSAIANTNRNPEKSLELLQKIDEKDINNLPFYYYRLAKLYEKKEKNLGKAFEYHIKACEQNEKLADIRLGKYIYDGFYPSKNPPFFKESDPIIWAGNISEKFSTLGIIHPVRCWKKGKKFIYCHPYPSDEALKVYKKREKEIFKNEFYKVGNENLIKVLSKLSIRELKVYPEENENDYESVFDELDIVLNNDSKNLLILNGVEQIEDLSELIRRYENVLIFYNVPDLKNREDEIWFYPPFRIFRTTAQLKEELNDLGFKTEFVEVLNKNLRFVLGKRKIKLS